MKKTSIAHCMLFWLLCLSIAPAFAQQNQKIVFPTPAPFTGSEGTSVTPTSDGGYLVLGQVKYADWNTVGTDYRPRIIKLDGNLNTVWENLYVPPALGKGGFVYPQGDAFELPDGDFVLGLHNDSSDVHVLRIHADGGVQNQITLPGQYERSAQVLDITDNGNFLVYVVANQPTLKHLDPNGNVVFSTNFNFGVPTVLANGDILYYKYTVATGKTILYRATNENVLLWQSQPIPVNFQGVVALPNNGFGAYSWNAQTNKWLIHYYDNTGLETSISPEITFPGVLKSLKSYPDGTLLVSGVTVTNRGFLQRIQSDGTVIWSAESPDDAQSPLITMSGAPTQDGWAVGAAGSLSDAMGFMKVSNNTGFFINTLTGSTLKDNDDDCQAEIGEPAITYTHVTASNGFETFGAFTNSLGQYSLQLPSGDFEVKADPDYPFFFQCPTAFNTVTFAPNANGGATLDLPIQSLALIHEIKGTVRITQNNDCTVLPSDPVAKFWDLKLRFGNQSLNLKTNANGEYQVFVPSGSYVLEFHGYNSSFATCGPTDYGIDLLSATPTTFVQDLVALANNDCAQMSVSIDNAQVRPCTTATFSINYRNAGAIAAQNAMMEVTLDPSLEYLSASPAPASVVGNIVQFNLGNVNPHQNSQHQEVHLTVAPSCSLQIGQQVCVTAHITPDVPCQTPAWQGAIVAVEGTCSSTSDSVIFKIRNIGNGPNLGVQDFVIVEDQIVLRNNTFQLLAGEEQIEAVLPMHDTTTITMQAEQEPGAPPPAIVTFSLSGCTGSGGTPNGLGGGAGPFTANKCFSVVNSYDPNVKLASPLGYGPEHLVRPETPLDYTIHFQNTGNDTAYQVILRDTISELMERGNIEITGASHPFDLALLNSKVLHIQFDNILLPDSATNPEASKGYISFSISPKPGLPNGTVVENRAAIYFDQNPPIITNTVSRTYGNYFLVSTDEKMGDASVQVKISPNPFMEEARFELPEYLPNQTLQLAVTDVNGKFIRSIAFTGKTCLFSRENLANGVHFWSITDAGKVIASGKILAVDH